MLDVIVQRVAQIGDDALADVLGQVGAAEADDAAHQEDADDREGQDLQREQVLVGEDVVEDVADEERHGAVGGAEEHHADDRARRSVATSTDAGRPAAGGTETVCFMRSAPAPGARRARAAPGSPSLPRSVASAAASSSRRAATSSHRRRPACRSVDVALEQLRKHAASEDDVGHADVLHAAPAGGRPRRSAATRGT